MKKFLLPEGGQFYKVNMHNHSTCSDGKQSPEEIKETYLSRGYSAVAFTDHGAMIDHSDLNDDRFVAINAFEYDVTNRQNPAHSFYTGEPRFPDHTEAVHLNFYAMEPDNLYMPFYTEQQIGRRMGLHRAEIHVREDEPEYDRLFTIESINAAIRRSRERGFLAIYNHPTWSLNNYTLYSRLENLSGLEIINGCSHSISDMDDVPYVYEQMMCNGQRGICVAGDDNHTIRAVGLAWTMVKAEKLDYRTLMNAIARGDCYASEGPSFEELWLEDNILHVRCSPVYGVYLHTVARRRVCRVSYDNSMTETTFELKPDEDLCFRVTLRDAAGRHAHSRFYYFDELK